MEFESEEFFAPQALPIGLHTVGIEPEDGLQYLSLVHSEASSIPDVMAADRSKFTAPLDLTSPSDVTTKPLQLPTELVNREMHKFSELRQYCRRMTELHPGKKQEEETELTPSKTMFDEEPSLSVVLGLSQVSIFELLGYIEEVCLSEEVKSRVPQAVTAWVFSLFCVVDKPVPMDYMAIIRGIGRLCGSLISSLSCPSSSEDTQYLVLFVLVCHYFEQVDLLEEFNAS